MDAADYEPLDLSDRCNLGPADYRRLAVEDGGSYLEARDDQPPVGALTLRGFPFQVGGPGGALTYIGPTGDGSTRVVDIPVGRTVTEVLFAHVLVGTSMWTGGAVGQEVGRYVFHLAGAPELVVPIRERFEVGTVPLPWGQYPFLCVPDRQDTLEDQTHGAWERAGFRRTEVSAGTPSAYYLWAWSNPDPPRTLERISVHLDARNLLIAGITLGSLGEEPLRPRTGQTIRLVLPEPVAAVGGLEVTVDRGIASYAHPLPAGPLDSGRAQRPGWGGEGSAFADRMYVDVAAIPSATIRVRAGDADLGAASAGEVFAGRTTTTGGATLECIDPGRNWVRVQVTDRATGAPVPCRVAFQSPAGVPYAPHGHHGQIYGGLPDWNVDIGGDVRLGSATYAYIDGTCEGWLPRGEVIVDVARGFEYEPLRTRVTITPGQTELQLSIARWSDVRADGWYSGDTHVHFLGAQGALTEAAGEDLNIVNLLQTRWGNLFTSTEEFTGEPLVSRDGQRIVWVSQENREHILGHLNLLGLGAPVMPWTTGGPGEAEIGGGLETTLSHWADAGRAQGATVVIAHFPTPNGEAAALVATDRADAVEMFDQLQYEHLEYYRYLDAGFRIPLVAGTDKMSSGTPVGLYRTYAHIPNGEPLSFAAWTAGLRAGRTFITSGPMLRFSVEGAPIGSTIRASAGARLEVQAEASSIFPIHTLQLISRGRVIDETTSRDGARTLRLASTVTVEDATWLAVRCGGPGYGQIRHFDERRRGIMAHTSPIYIAVGDVDATRDSAALRHMLALVDGSRAYVRAASPRYPEDRVTHARGRADHDAFLEAPLVEASERLRGLLREGPR